MNFRGDCMGVRLEKRDDKDKHIVVVLETEDDEQWFEKTSFSSYWLDELIEVLQAASSFCKSQEPDIVKGEQFGWKFKKK